MPTVRAARRHHRRPGHTGRPRTLAGARLFGRAGPRTGRCCWCPATPAARRTSCRCCGRWPPPATGRWPSTSAASTSRRGPATRPVTPSRRWPSEVCQLAAELATGRAGLHLVGHSLGGLVGRAAVLAKPELFDSFTLMGSGPDAVTGQRRALLDAGELVLASRGMAGLWSLPGGQRAGRSEVRRGPRRRCWPSCAPGSWPPTRSGCRSWATCCAPRGPHRRTGRDRRADAGAARRVRRRLAPAVQADDGPAAGRRLRGDRRPRRIHRRWRTRRRPCAPCSTSGSGWTDRARAA